MKKKLYTLLLLSVFPLCFFAQAPGGVLSDLTMWVRANSGTITTGGLVDTWTYANDGTKSFGAIGTERPTLTASAINFQPALTFAGTQLMQGPNGILAPITQSNDAYSVFGVWISTTTAPFQRIWSQTAGTTGSGVSLWIYNPGPTLYGDQAEIPPYDHIATRTYTQSTWNISQLNLLNTPTSDIQIVDDRNFATAPLVLNTDPGGTNGPAIRDIQTPFNLLGSRSLTPGDEGFTGRMAEIIVFNRPISGAERARVFSYLSIKYGIPIQTNLVSSASATVWDATANAAYNNDVFGFALDNASGLSVSQTNSISNGSGNGTGQSGKANIVLSNPSALTTDQTFLLIGHNTGALTQTGTNVPAAAAGSQRLVRQWKVQRAGNPGTFNASFNLNGLTITGTNAVDFRLIVDQDGDGNFATGTTRYYTPTTYAGGIASFTGLTLNNNEVFALITAVNNVTLPVTWKAFDAKSVNGKTLLTWEVENTEKSLQYEIEYSVDGITFNKVATVANRESARLYNYTYAAALINGANYFRIRQVDIDGRFVYSKTVSLRGSADFSMVLISNPITNNNAELRLTSSKAMPVTLEVWSTGGVKVSSKQQTLVTGVNNVQVDMSKAAKGNYILQVRAGLQLITEKIVKL